MAEERGQGIGAPKWVIVGATAQGASHRPSGTPNQDSYDQCELSELGNDAVAVAVADGHGHHRHFRSDRGSRLASTVACACARRSVDALGELASAESLRAYLDESMAPSIVETWRLAVRADIESDPYDVRERGLLASRGDSDDVPYGSTLILVLTWSHWVVILQIGDGDAVVMSTAGTILTPVPRDGRIDRYRTASLCQSQAVSNIRVAVLDGSTTDVLGILLCTDGFSNAQVVEPWQPTVGADLIRMIRSRDEQWFAEQIAGWAAQCASPEGSGDDTTIVLMFLPPASTIHPTPTLGSDALFSSTLSHKEDSLR